MKKLIVRLGSGGAFEWNVNEVNCYGGARIISYICPMVVYDACSIVQMVLGFYETNDSAPSASTSMNNLSVWRK